MSVPAYKDGEVVGNYEFSMADNMCISASARPIKMITFAWNPEWVQLKIWDDPNDIYELFGEQLKQDFIDFLKQKHAGQR